MQEKSLLLNRRRKCCVLVCILLLVWCIYFPVTAITEPELQSSQIGRHVSFFNSNESKYIIDHFTKDQIGRYNQIWVNCLNNVEFNWLKYQLTIQDHYKYENSTTGRSFINGLPSECAIGKTEALFSVYEEMENKYMLDEFTLARFFPLFRYNIANPEEPEWEITLDPTYEHYAIDEIGMYLVYINAYTGDVIRTISSKDGDGDG